MSTKFDIENLCRLAHLEIDEKERKDLEDKLIRIVLWVDKLKEYSQEICEERSNQGEAKQTRLRQDVVLPSLSQKEALDNAPETEKGFFKVPKVIESK